MFQPKSFGETVKPVLLLQFLFGIGSPACLMKHKVKKSVEIIYTVCALAAFHLTLYHQYCCWRYFRMFEGRKHSSLNFASFLSFYITVLTLIIAPRFNKEDVQNIITFMEEIDEKMDAIGLPKQHRAQYKYEMYSFFWSLMHLALNVLIQWYFVLEANIPIYHKILLSFTGNVIPILPLTVHVSFCFWIRYIRTKFSQLNYLMEEMIDSSGPKRFLEISDYQIKRRRCLNVRLVKGNVQIIMKAKECHLDLIKIARRVNKFFGVHLLSILVFSVMTILEMLYMINVFMWFSGSVVDLFMEIFPVVVWILLNSFRMIHLHSNCMQTSTEAGKTGYLLCRLYDSSTSMRFRIEVQRFAQQVQQNPLVLHVCRLVDIDDTFLTSTVGWVFTYIIVILQLQTQHLQRKLDANSTFVTPASN